MLDRIIEVITHNRLFLITSHVRPDGDSIGSELGLYHLLRRMGTNEVVVYNQDPIPGNYRFLPGTEDIVHALGSVEPFDAVFILDCSDLERIGEEAPRIGRMKRIINIDHHITNGDFGPLTFIDTQASSTSELVCRLADKMELEMTKDAADNLYAGILTDTGGFCYGNTGSETLIIAGRLVEKGADPQWLSENIYESNPIEKIRLLTRTLETLRFDLNGRVGSMVVTQDALASSQALIEYTEGFVDVPRTVQGVEISLLFSEVARNQYKLSLRSKGKTNVEPIARKFGGGGHMNAAACRIEGDFETVRQRVLNEIRSLLNP